MANILIVDDQPCVRELLSEELIDEGYHVHGVGDAKSVSEYLLLSKPDLVLLDIYLEGAEGFGLLEDIKKQYPQLPVIVVTAYDSFTDDPRLSHADGYVIKSVNFDELKQRIAQVLMHKPALQTTKEADSRYPRFAIANRFWPNLARFRV
jgi:two-component system response regulator (stage 0 sporulation protein F)